MQSFEFTTSERITFEARPPRTSEMDMTSMVDVTFLLLVFFMVTASFVTMSIFDQRPVSDLASPIVDVDEHSTVEIKINDQGKYRMLAADPNEELNSLREIRSALQLRFESNPELKLRIVAHNNSSHSSVVKLWDVATASGVQDITTKTTDTIEF